MITYWKTYFLTLTPFSKMIILGCGALALAWLFSLLGLGNGLPFPNPQIECPATIHTHADDAVFEDTIQRSLADLEQFCTHMRTTFHQSVLTHGEAAAVQAIFQELRDRNATSMSREEQKLHFSNDYYPVAAGLFEDRRFQIPQRVMLKKDDISSYQIFYYSVECGVTYHYQHVTLAHDHIGHVKTLASWSTRSSC